ncbi:MAG: GNAT family N-acetyltransferase [Saprospiraceae bacterium]
MDLQPTLKNDLLLLRPLAPDDLDALHAAANDPLMWDQHPDKRNDRSVFEKFFEGALESKGALVVVHRNSNTIIGTSRYYMYDGFPDGVEIGWTFLSRQHWGGMYNKMMKKLMITHALKSLSSVYLFVDQDNYRSQKATQKIGARPFTHEEIGLHPVTRSTNVSYIITKAEWKG